MAKPPAPAAPFHNHTSTGRKTRRFSASADTVGPRYDQMSSRTTSFVTTKRGQEFKMACARIAGLQIEPQGLMDRHSEASSHVDFAGNHNPKSSLQRAIQRSSSTATPPARRAHHVFDSTIEPTFYKHPTGQPHAQRSPTSLPPPNISRTSHITTTISSDGATQRSKPPRVSDPPSLEEPVSDTSTQ